MIYWILGIAAILIVLVLFLEFVLNSGPSREGAKQGRTCNREAGSRAASAAPQKKEGGDRNARSKARPRESAVRDFESGLRMMENEILGVVQERRGEDKTDGTE